MNRTRLLEVQMTQAPESAVGYRVSPKPGGPAGNISIFDYLDFRDIGPL